MVELLPLSQAELIKQSLLDYLGTTFALADPDARRVLSDFLQDKDTGMFRGPYLRTRLPFREADPGWRDALEWYEGFTPYRHQAAAFARLSSRDTDGKPRRPQPTLVTTGTGSGKTEAFLYPILDHVQRANRLGVTGTKALILYPMNALANDQAQRLATMITTHGGLAGITAALYTGEAGTTRTTVTPDGLITDRAVIRDTAPDILLTNYKMLDQLLLRHADARLWEQSATSLQYLVLDEFHTYDGAQGTDVSMLLRRLGHTLKTHWGRHDASVSADDRTRPLGLITPVATSATLGDGGDPSDMISFAETVFGEDFDREAVVSESRITLEEWGAGAADRVSAAGWKPPADGGGLPLAALAAIRSDAPAETTRRVLACLYGIAENGVALTDHVALDLVKSHPVFHNLITESADAVSVDTLIDSVRQQAYSSQATNISTDDLEQVLVNLVTSLSHLRAVLDRSATPSVEAHLWIRELTRVDRFATGAPTFSWADDGVLVDAAAAGEPTAPVFPAIYCRHCNRSGWGVLLAPTGTDLAGDDSTIRRRHAQRDDRFRALIHAPNEATHLDGTPDTERPNAIADGAGLMWWLVTERTLTGRTPDTETRADGHALPVLVVNGRDAGAESVHDTCPSCRQRDGIRFLGSAIATMLSVSLSTLFGTPGLDSREKRALVFTDSVQDAAHRAGFIQARSHTLTLRTVLRRGLAHGATDLESLARRVITLAGNSPLDRYRLLPPELAERNDFRDFWTAPGSDRLLEQRVLRRLLLDIDMEFGLRSAVGRTLERTATVTVQIDIPTPALIAIARSAFDADGAQISLGSPSDQDLLRWIHGVLLRMRRRGAIEHDWFARFRREDGNRWWITGGRLRNEGMPGFGRGSSAPGYPVVGGSAKDTDLEPVASPRGWYAQWTAKSLGTGTTEGATLARLLFARLAARNILGEEISTSGARTYALRTSHLVARAVTDTDLELSGISLACDICRDIIFADTPTINALAGGPCTVPHCTGRLRPNPMGRNFYREMYSDRDIRRVVAREHTSLLPDELRVEYETQFKQSDPPPDAPNVLVATPTLEMGIDIGDLSAVLLSSLPRTVASYLQRVGRAGRLTGNALALAYVTGRGDQLPRFAEPTDTINGVVRPPATYLDAEEILLRQFFAAITDSVARRGDVKHPRTTGDALRATDATSFLGTIIAEAESNAQRWADAFLAAFPPLNPDVVATVRSFPTAPSGPGSSPLALRCHRASAEWNRRIEILRIRIAAIDKLLPELETKATSPAATLEDTAELRTAQATRRLLNGQLAGLRSEYWIGALETFGLLPNYTLLDDSVNLAVSVTWRNPETDTPEHSEFELSRGSARALQDFAPGSTFYARGFAIAIDAVDLGIHGEAIHEWACCSACGFTVDLTETAAPPPGSCPRCGSAQIGDTGQRLRMIELQQVSAVIRRDEATIGDATDERERRAYTVVTAADIDPALVTAQWYESTLGFGVKHLRRMTIRWLNLGGAGIGGTTRILAGAEARTGLFRLCAECGKLDTFSGVNKPSEHRPWCSLRKAAEEDTVDVALTRSLTTEGLVVRLPPSVTLGDTFAMPSLSAAVLLGLRERLGGAPDHLQIATIIDPSATGPDRWALLLHDIVPGGTGYLADLTAPDKVWDLLYRAWSAVAGCSCRLEGKLACERCLLPFALPAAVRYTSRAAAESHLAVLLRGSTATPGPDEPAVPAHMPWNVTTDEPATDDAESDLEKRFRVAFRKRLDAIHAVITESPSNKGVVWGIRLGTHNRWTLRPQENILGSKPDFLLTSALPNVPPTAIFTDGWAFHASPAHNRLADDAEKRQNLRLGGYQVIAVTRADVDGDIPAAATLSNRFIAPVQQMASDQLPKGALDFTSAGALDLLLDWIQQHSLERRSRLARWLPVAGLFEAHTNGRMVSDGNLAERAIAELDGPSAPLPGGNVAVRRHGPLTWAFRLIEETAVDLAIVLDDDDAAVGVQAKDAWYEWLRWSNLLNFRPLPYTITTRRHHAAGLPDVETPAAELVAAHSAEPAMTGAWLEAWESAAGPDERKILERLFGDGVPAPTVGEEIYGIPVEIAWPEHKVVLGELIDEADIDDLTNAGWRVIASDSDEFSAAVLEKGV